MVHASRPRAARNAALAGLTALCLLSACAQATSDQGAAPTDTTDAAAGQAGDAGEGGSAGTAGSASSGGSAGTGETGGAAGSATGGTGGSGASGATGGSGGSVATGGTGGMADDAGADAGEPCGSIFCTDWKCVNPGAGLTMSEWGCCVQPDECGAKTTETSTTCLPIGLIENLFNVQCTPK